MFNIDAIRIPYKAEFTPARGVHGRDYDRRAARARHDMGKVPEDWWADGHLSNVSAWRKELVGYPTQKPLALLKRIIEASSNPGDTVLDPFCGCATTCVAAEKLGRKWIGIDIEEETGRLIRERLEDTSGLFKDFDHWAGEKYLPHRTDEELVDIKKPQTKREIRERLHKEQNGKCLACNPPRKIALQDMHIDHIKPYSKGGANSYENYQLLCMACNTRKRERSMEYLLARNKKLAEEGIERIYRDIRK